MRTVFLVSGMILLYSSLMLLIGSLVMAVVKTACTLPIVGF